MKVVRWKHFSSTETLRVGAGFAAGESDAIIAKALNRSVRSIISKRRTMGLMRYVAGPGPGPDLVEWQTMETDTETMMEYAEVNKIRRNIDAVNAFRVNERLPKFRVTGSRWAA